MMGTVKYFLFARTLFSHKLARQGDAKIKSSQTIFNK